MISSRWAPTGGLTFPTAKEYLGRIMHAVGETYYQGEPITLADAQMMLNNDIAEGKVEVGSFLKIDDDCADP